ncbi:hypothetical protein [Muricoccus nepalensis]|uniref:hypothetical protein n=1 Tax=Muricoccus nepalensis TaxID=1854500 RepID=UPI0013874924|nr:hypothetical protein [Roseomonas nepalensis]
MAVVIWTGFVAMSCLSIAFDLVEPRAEVGRLACATLAIILCWVAPRVTGWPL